MKRNAVLVLAWLALAGLAGAVSPALPVIPAGTFNITNYGAIGNGVFTNTDALQATVNAVGAAGGGTLVVPAGTFLCGPFTLTNNLRLKLDAGAVLKLLPYGSYPGSAAGTEPPDFIYMSRGHDIEFSGPGAFDGQGQAWWDANLDISLKPYLFHIEKTFQRLWFHGLTMTNTPMKHIVIDGIGGDVLIENMVIHEPGDSPNTDGINLQGTNCLVRDCDISVGDDNIAMGRSSGPGADILITNITCGTGHGISIGSITKAGESNITVVNCSFTGTDFGLRLKSDNDRGGLVQNIHYYNIAVTNVGMPILIYSYYNVVGSATNVGKTTPAKAASYVADPVTNTTPVWRDIAFSNITGTASAAGATIWGRTEMLVSNVTLSRVNITAPKTFNIYNARGISIVDSQFNFAGGGTFSLFNAQVTVSNSAPGTGDITLDGIATNSLNNELLLYKAPASLKNTNLLGDIPRLTLGGGTLTISNNLSLAVSSAVNFVLAPATIAVTGNLKLAGTLNIAGNYGPGEYTLFSYGGGLSGIPAFGWIPGGYTYSLNTNTPGLVKLVVTSINPPPNIGTVSVAGGNLFINAGGGPANGNCYLLASTNLALPLTNWTRLATNPFNAGGSLVFTSSTAGISRRYFSLQLP